MRTLTQTELRRIVETSARKVLHSGCPPARYWTLVDVYDKDFGDPVVVQTLKDVESYPHKLKLLERLREDGTWPISSNRKAEEDSGPGPPFGWTYITMLRKLHELGDYCAKRTDGHIIATLEKILGWQTEKGCIPGPHPRPFISPYHNSFALRDLLQYGMEGDQRVQRLAKWLLEQQRPDGGWIVPIIQDMRYEPSYNAMRMRDFITLMEGPDAPPYDPDAYADVPSCIWSTMMAVRALCWSPDLVKTDAVRRGAEFFLDRFFQRNYHPSYNQSEKNWTTLKYPTYFGCGIIALDILTYMGYDLEDVRMVKPIEWLAGARSRDGLWHTSDRPHDEKDLMLSSTALCVLARVSGISTRRIDTQPKP